MDLFYSLGLVVCFIIFFLHLKILSDRKRLIGTIKEQWSTIFSPYLPLNWLKWLLVAVYLIWSIIWLVKAPEAKGPHGNFLLVALLLSFSPRAQVYYGSRGIIIKMRAITWKQIIEKKVIVKSKRKFLVIKLEPSASPRQKTIKIPLPTNIRGINKHNK